MKYLLYVKSLRHLYNTYVRNRRRETRLLVLIFFTLTFIIARIIVYGITYHFLPTFPFSYVFYKDVHIHHLVFGIILLLIAGFIRIPEMNNNLVRLSSVLYGIGAALTLDEFAIWLKLDPNAYFGPEGRISIDAVVLFSLIFLFTWWYGNFVKRLVVFTLSYLGIIKKHPGRHRKKKSVIRRIFGFLSLGIVSFYLVITVLPYIKTFQVSGTMPPKGLIQAIVSSEDLISGESEAAEITPSFPSLPVEISPLSVAPAASQSADFCLTIPVLMYHHVQPLDIAQERGQLGLTVDTTVFDQQMNYLVQNGYTTISAETLASALHEHRYLPMKDIVVTLDDGYEDNYTDAFPIAKKYHVILNLMVAAGLLGKHIATNDYYTWDQLREMVNSGLVYAGDHTWSHYPVGLGTPEVDQFEILTARQQLEQHLGRPVTIFTYPYGSGEDMPSIANMLEQDGFIGGFSTIDGTLQCESYVMSLHRTRIGSAYFPDFGIQ